MLLLFAGMVSQCLAQEARIVMPAGKVNESYHESIATVLQETFNRNKSFSDWQVVGPPPVGFGLDRETGLLYGTSASAETQMFRVQAFYRSKEGRRVTEIFLIVLQIKAAESEESSEQSTPQRQTPPKSRPSPSLSPSPPPEENEQVAADEGNKGKSSDKLQVKHSGLVSDKDEKTYVGIVAGRDVEKISIAAFEKGEDGQLTKPLEEIKAPILTRDKNDYLVLVPLSKTGATKVTVKDLTPKSKLEQSVEIKKEKAASTAAAGATGTGDDDKKRVTVVKPTTKSTISDGSFTAYLKVSKNSEIKKIRYRVTNGDNSYTDELAVNPTKDKDDEKPVRIRILKGTNVVRFVNAADETKADDQAEIEINCDVNCASSFKLAEFVGSQNARAIVGFEQAGASSASSETKPFIDFFFSTPFWFTGDCGKKPADSESEEKKQEYKTCMLRRPPRLAVWGNVRLAATPDQIAAIGVLPSNFANTFGDPRNTVDLVQSFDFLMGLEGRLFTANGRFLSLIPGLPQKTRFYIAGGGGAISPLNPRRELAQIFKIPAENSPQRDDFIARFGTPPSSNPAKEFVGLVPLDRDRFLRQWYAGLRLKTFYCHNDECTEYENTFPSQVDVMFGQSEAVTGGSLFYLKPDPNDPTKNIKKRSFVLRFDAFYPFPLQRANFLYFYGTAIMKIGAGGVRIQNSLFLDRAADDVQITDPRVYIPSSDLQKMFQPSRDYYKLGMGIDLIGLINRVTH